MEELVAYPQTLLHNDLDDRNIGLRWAKARSTLDQPTLILIDWEWLALGPAALDVANILQRVPVLIMLGSPVGAVIPPVVWSDALIDGYFAHYRAAGGRCVDAADWRRACGLALIVQGLAQMPFIVPYALEGLAGVLGRRQQPQHGAWLLGAADTLRQGLENPHSPIDAAFYQPILTSIQTQLGAPAFQTAWQHGRQCTATQAIAEARLAIHGNRESAT
ncbi:MAG: hypothetical protein DYG89_52920 [Caldilinea sp. CFX5]|nr:hypothetical protein [Caldilinea sp. CFX5]